jgi:hypothetical protein
MDYSKGKIYCIKSHHTDKVYIGSTTKTLEQRLTKHKECYMGYKRGYKYQLRMTSFDILNYGDAYIELVENYPCNTKQELIKREGEVIRSTKNSVNKDKWLGLGKERHKLYVEEHSEYFKEKSKEWRENNKEHRAKKYKEWEEKNAEYRKQYKQEWKENNRERVRETQREYRKKNYDKLGHRYSAKITCEICNKEISKRNMARHKRTIHN